MPHLIGTRHSITYPPAQLIRAGLVSWHRFNELSGASLLDAVGTKPGTHVNSPTYSGGGVAYVTGSSQRTDTAAGILPNMVDDFTIMFAFQSATAGGSIITLADPTSNAMFHTVEMSAAATMRINSRGTVSLGVSALSGNVSIDNTKVVIAALVMKDGVLTLRNLGNGAVSTVISQAPSGVPRLGYSSLARLSPAQYLTGTQYEGAGYIRALRPVEQFFNGKVWRREIAGRGAAVA